MASNKLKLILPAVKESIRYYRYPILSGILIGTSYIPFPPWALLFCLSPLWYFCITEKSVVRILFGAWITQFISVIIGFNWIAYTIHEFGQLPWAIAFLGLVAFASFASLFIPIAVGLWLLIHKKILSSPPLSLQSLLLLGVLTGIANRFTPTLFPWNMGYPWIWAELPIYQLGEFVGFQGLSTLTIISSALLLWGWMLRERKKGKTILVATVISFLSLNLLGLWAEKRWPEPDNEARIMIVQANIGNLAKVYAEKGWGFREHIVDKYLHLTKQGLSEDPRVDFALWPETAFSDDLGPGYDNHSNAKKLKKFLRDNKISLATGAYSETLDTAQTTNSMFFLDRNGNYSDSHYYKTHLLAFGEYLPLSETFPILRQWLPQVANFARGQGPAVKKLDGFKLGPQICYESLYPRASVEMARLGAQIFLNSTNDSWYGTWQEPYQHLYMTLARAIEVRRPLVRATNTGISTAISAKGQVMDQSPLHKEWSHVYKVPYRRSGRATLFVTFPWLMTALEILAAIALIVNGRLWNRK